MNAAEEWQRGPSDAKSEHEKAPETRSWPHFLADNTPTIITYGLGTVLLLQLDSLAATTYAVYCIASTVLIWRFVCTHCQYFGGVCKCGFSVVATRLFEKGDESKIKSRKILLALLVLPCWVVPPLLGIYMLVTGFSWTLFWLFMAFGAMAFAITPYISWKIGCCDVWQYISRSK
ncbi:MAG: hypothetical protein ACE5QF_01025 [Thermoplasmata archaeon]